LEGDDTYQADRLAQLRNVLPSEILVRAASIPISSLSRQENVGLDVLCLYLPSADVATNLKAIYYSYAAWMYVFLVNF
jgi:hypothetical protein